MPRIVKRQRLIDYTAARGWTRIGEAEWIAIRAALPDISERAVRNAGLPIDAPWCGVNQHSLEELAVSLTQFAEIYESRPDLQGYCRKQVIASKDHARLASRNPRLCESRQLLKAEMVEWMLIWLGDPSVFPVWAGLRHRIG